MRHLQAYAAACLALGSLFSVRASAAAGDLDLTFGVAGVVVIDIGNQSTDGATSVSVGADGRMLVAGSSDATGPYTMTLVELDERGNVVDSFGDEGRVMVDNGNTDGAFAAAMLRDATGNIYLAGSQMDFGIYLMAVTRLNPDGTPGWSPGGIHGICDGNTCSGYALARDAVAGNLFIVGYADLGTPDSDFFIWKIDSAGNTAAGWNVSGLFDFGDHNNDRAFATALDGSGGLYAAGYSFSFTSGSYDFAILKIRTADGSLDSSFGVGGLLRVDIGAGSDDEAYAMTVDAFGNLYVAGTSNAAGSYRFTVIKLDSHGNPVTGFGDGGKVISALDGYAVAIGFDGRGKLYLVGTSSQPASNDFAALELDATTGAPVASFGDGGQRIIDLHLASNDQVFAMGIDGSGRVIIAGQTNSAGSNDFALVRLQPNPADSVYASGFDQ